MRVPGKGDGLLLPPGYLLIYLRDTKALLRHLRRYAYVPCWGAWREVEELQ